MKTGTHGRPGYRALRPGSLTTSAPRTSSRVRPGLLTPSDLNDAYAKQSESQYQGTRAWAAADQRVTDYALVIPIGAGSTLGFTSKRVGNYQFAPAPGNSPIIDQMWVR